MYRSRCGGLVKETFVRLPGSCTSEPFLLDSPHTHLQPDHVPFPVTRRVPLAEPTTSCSTRQFIPGAGTTLNGHSEEHPWAFIPSHSSPYPLCQSLPHFSSCFPSMSIHLTSHWFSSPYPKGWPPPRAQCVFPSAVCRLSCLEEKYFSPALSCPGPLSPPTSQFLCANRFPTRLREIICTV